MFMKNIDMGRNLRRQGLTLAEKNAIVKKRRAERQAQTQALAVKEQAAKKLNFTIADMMIPQQAKQTKAALSLQTIVHALVHARLYADQHSVTILSFKEYSNGVQCLFRIPAHQGLSAWMDAQQDLQACLPVQNIVFLQTDDTLQATFLQG